jgi:hypothetical protein
VVRPSVRVLVTALAVAAVTAVAPGLSAASPAPAAGPAETVVRQLAVDAKARAADLNTPEANALAKNLDDLLKQVPAHGSAAPAADGGGLVDLLKQIIDSLLKLLGLGSQPTPPPGQSTHLSARAAQDPVDPYRQIVDGVVSAVADRAGALPAGDRKDEVGALLDRVKAEVGTCLAAAPAPPPAYAADSDVDCASALPKLPGEIERTVELTAPAPAAVPAGHAR